MGFISWKLHNYNEAYNILMLKQKKNVSIGDKFKYGDNVRFLLYEDIEKLNIFSNVTIRHSCNFLLYPNSSLIIRQNVFFNNFCSINCLEKIEIGENSIFGEGVKIYDHNHLYDQENSLSIKRGEFTTAPVNIGQNCWIGSNVTILKGVTIGNNVIVGANCLIYKSIPSDSVVKHKEDLIIQSR
jgi:acetyltransferase-like isoleucine patch superfamily enzyme